MNDQTLQLLRQLADKLGTTAEHLWAVLVKQAGIEARMDAGFAAMFLLLLVGSLVFTGYAWVKKQEEEYSDWEIGLVVAAVFSFLWLICFCVFASSSFTEFYNPEYWALKQILSAGK